MPQKFVDLKSFKALDKAINADHAHTGQLMKIQIAHLGIFCFSDIYISICGVKFSRLVSTEFICQASEAHDFLFMSAHDKVSCKNANQLAEHHFLIQFA